MDFACRDDSSRRRRRSFVAHPLADAVTTETRELVAILAADVVGFSRLTGADEERTLAAESAACRIL